jgi:hypothetical protein
MPKKKGSKANNNNKTTKNKSLSPSIKNTPTQGDNDNTKTLFQQLYEKFQAASEYPQEIPAGIEDVSEYQMNKCLKAMCDVIREVFYDYSLIPFFIIIFFSYHPNFYLYR